LRVLDEDDRAGARDPLHLYRPPARDAGRRRARRPLLDAHRRRDLDPAVGDRRVGWAVDRILVTLVFGAWDLGFGIYPGVRTCSGRNPNPTSRAGIRR